MLLWGCGGPLYISWLHNMFANYMYLYSRTVNKTYLHTNTCIYTAKATNAASVVYTMDVINENASNNQSDQTSDNVHTVFEHIKLLQKIYLSNLLTAIFIKLWTLSATKTKVNAKAKQKFQVYSAQVVKQSDGPYRAEKNQQNFLTEFFNWPLTHCLSNVAAEV